MPYTGGRTIREVILPGGASAFLNANGEFVEVERLEGQTVSILPGSEIEAQIINLKRAIEEIGQSPYAQEIFKILGDVISSRKVNVSLGEEKVSVNVIPTEIPQPVSISSIPLPDNASKEKEGNLEKINNFNTTKMEIALDIIAKELRLISLILHVGFQGRLREILSIDLESLRNELESITLIQ